MKVGIPRALLYYKFFPMWTTFFRELGVEVVISPHTTKTIKTEAIKIAPDEDCYSTKLYFGHVMAIKDEVDYLFVPRFGSKHKTNVGCPKFIGLAEILRSMFPDLPPIIMPFYSTAKSGHGKKRLIEIIFSIGFKFTKNPFRIIKAAKRALKEQKIHLEKLILDENVLQKWELTDFRMNPVQNTEESEPPLKFVLVGHSYVINDELASLSIRKILTDHGVDFITSEQTPRNLIEKQMDKLDFNLYFDYEREILGTIMHYLQKKTVDGIIHLIIFSCGPDSIAGEMAVRFAQRSSSVPLLQLTFDELTSETGLKTRIEAFLDLSRRRQKECQLHTLTLDH